MKTKKNCTFAANYTIMANYDALTTEEKRYIRAHSEDMAIEEIALALGRGYSTVQKYAKSTGRGRYHTWTAEEDAMLMSLWKEYCAEYISRRMGIDVNSIYNRIRRLKRNGKWLQRKDQEAE